MFESPLREQNPGEYCRQVLRRFLTRAYRRPATEQEIDVFAQIFALVSEELESPEAAYRETLAMALISPQFLFHTLATDSTVSNHDEIASRLSYFLWRSMPDDELRQLAAERRLTDPDVIRQQVERLLADPRANDFVDNFATQW